ncbi:MAG: hypothetical protein PHI12_12645 [Dehalococcoidales bacterium]|nr:hypothetical protein [Sphaerochaeta sp.]MDD5511639.1 hypothetical protein [Dehalococcoidales bacterium]
MATFYKRRGLNDEEALVEAAEEDPYELRGKFAERFVECKALSPELERSTCLYELLHDVTRLQDVVNLSMRPTNVWQQHAQELIDGANALILEASQNHSPWLAESIYLDEKVDKVNRVYMRIKKEKVKSARRGIEEQVMDD